MAAFIVLLIISSPRHPHASTSNLQTGARIAMFGLAINVLLAAAKLLAGLFGHAHVLIADGIESTLDVGGSIVIWGGSRGPGVPTGGIHHLHMARVQP